ncbi:MAG: SDR family oxidoreductase [Candidatus Poribacteria bacterium]|nr:SDR family oxidoreductase [Candidatus Poribacteria bacterium]
MSERVLIAGGSGFLGSHLSDLFLSRGYRVLCMDNFSTGNRRNTAHLSDNPHFEAITADITEPVRVDGDLAYVLNFASPASPPDYLKMPIETLKVGAWGTYHLLELAREKNAVFLQASTSEVYGDPDITPQPESYWGNVNPIGPRSVYDEAKRYGEAMTMAFHRHFGVKTRLLRIFNVYGPRMRPNDGRAIPNFVTQALRNEDITVYGDGSQTRSLCYVADEVDGIFRLAMSDESDPVNIGNPSTEITMLALAETILKRSGSKSKIVFRDLPKDDPKQRRPDITRAKAILGWEPFTSLEDGLGKTIDYFRDLQSAGEI